MATEVVLFDTREAAAAWGVTTRTVERWVDVGRARPAKRTRGFIFTGEEVARVGQMPRPKRGGFRGRRGTAQAPQLPIGTS